MKTGDELKLSEFECADCGATINEGEYVTFGVCDKCFQKNYRERMGLPEEKKNTMENMTKEQAIEKMYKKPFIYDQDGQRVVDQDNNWALDVRGWGRIQNLYPTHEEAAAAQDAFGEHVVKCLNGSTASGSVAAPKEETNIDDNPATYTHFDMLAMVARQTKHMFEENEQLREALKELLKFADMYLHSKVLEYARGNFEKSELEESAAIIERARKLLNP